MTAGEPWGWQPDPSIAPRDEVLFTVGDIAVSRYWIVTPTEAVPIHGTRWVCRDLTHTQRVMPGYAVVLAIVFLIACFLGLLFLAIREDVLTGVVEVQVSNADGFYHVCQVHVRNQQDVVNVQQAVAHAQHLASQAQ